MARSFAPRKINGDVKYYRSTSMNRCNFFRISLQTPRCASASSDWVAKIGLFHTAISPGYIRFSFSMSGISPLVFNAPAFPTDHVLPQHASTLDLPNWEWEMLRLKLLLLLLSILWLVALPYFVFFRSSTRSGNASATANGSTQAENGTNPGKVGKKRRFWYRMIFVFPTVVSVFVLGFLVSAALVISVVSPYNRYLSRRVFQSPLLTEDECQRIIALSHVVAAKNIEKFAKYNPKYFSETENLMLYEEPYGWQKVRHEDYPTTDLNLITDPFEWDDQAFILGILDQRLAPIISRIYGIPIRSIQAQDIFVVRYDANLTRHKLKKHTDGGDISFTVFLNHEFEGGGTQFWNRHTKEPFRLLQSNASGHVSFFHAGVEHEGFPTTKGIRFILVGFLNVRRYDEDGVTPVGLSLFASWLNWNWAFHRVADYIKDYDWQSKLWRKRAMRTLHWIFLLQDRFSTHAVVPPLMVTEQLPEFLHAVAGAYNMSDRTHKARWLEGQSKRAFVNFINEMCDAEDPDDWEDEDESEEEL
jgi:hypothetical protein